MHNLPLNKYIEYELVAWVVTCQLNLPENWCNFDRNYFECISDIGDKSIKNVLGHCCCDLCEGDKWLCKLISVISAADGF